MTIDLQIKEALINGSVQAGRFASVDAIRSALQGLAKGSAPEIAPVWPNGFLAEHYATEEVADERAFAASCR